MSLINVKVPVYVGARLVEVCDAARASRLMARPNVETTRVRKTGAIARLTIHATVASVSDEDEGGGGGNDRSLTYRETLAGRDVTLLKRYDGDSGRFVRWSDRDSFNPRRFNPDRVPPALRVR